MSKTEGPLTLIRGLGPAAAIAVVIGNVIGTGVFLKTRVMTCNAEMPLLVILAWVAAGALSIAGALTYAELAAMMPHAGGDYVFVRRVYGKVWGFLYGWTQLTVIATGSQAAKGIGLAIFLNTMLGGTLSQPFLSYHWGAYEFAFGPIQTIAIAMIILTTLVNCLAVSLSGGLAVMFTVLKIIIVLGVGVGAFALADNGWSHYTELASAGLCEGIPATARASQAGWLSGFGAAVLGALWAYDGWSAVTYVAGEVRNPQRNLPLALIGGIIAVAALYVFLNAAFLYAFSPQDIADVPVASSVASEVMKRFFGRTAVSLVAMAMTLSTLGSLHTSTMSGSRITYAMALDGLFFKPLAKLSAGSRVPVNALLLHGAWASLLVFTGSFDVLTNYVIFTSWIFYAMVAASLFLLRRRDPGAERPFRTMAYPYLPGLFLLTALLLIFNTLLTTPYEAMVGLGIMTAGLPLYWLYLRKGQRG